MQSPSAAVVTTSDINPRLNQLISWEPAWRELDLVLGIAVDVDGNLSRIDPSFYSSVPRAGVQLADVTLEGSQGSDRIFAGVGSLVDAAGGSDELFNTESQGGNLLIGGLGADDFFLNAAGDVVIGGRLLAEAASLGLPEVIALTDRAVDQFFIDSSDPAGVEPLRILDYEPGIDQLLLNGEAPQGDWLAIRQQLEGLNVELNAAPELSATPVVISLKRGIEINLNLSSFGTDLDGDTLQLLKVKGPEWITTSGTTLRATAPLDLTAEQLASIDLQLAFSDGKAAAVFSPQLDLVAAPQPVPVPAPKPVPVPAPKPDPITGQPLAPSINQITIGLPVEVGTSFKLPRNASESTVILTGSNDINARGNSGDNALIGNSGSNSIRAGGGNDSVWGREGNDRLKGGKGTDQFIFSSERGLFNVGAEGRDFIVDFKPRQGDRISLSASSFGLASAKGNGFSNSREFAIVSNIDAAAASNASIVYETSSNQLFFNSNGSGGGFGANGGAFALFKNRVDLAADDFSII